MLKVIFTLDYEIHGNGDGDPRALMVEPTHRLLKLFEQYGARLTIMADVAEVLRFREYWQTTGRDDFHYQEIARQLQDALARGHDVQLHLHPSYFNARVEGCRWIQDWGEYNFATLPLDRMSYMIRVGKEYLENLLGPVKSDYRCLAFRAANWAAQPSQNLVRALLDNGFCIETSVFKHGRRAGLVQFDYSNAPSNLAPWPVDEQDVCRRDPSGQLWEFPIYCEQRSIGAFLTPQRLYRALVGRLHRVPAGQIPPTRSPGPAPHRPPANGDLTLLRKRHAWKADFNQCTGRQLIGALERAQQQFPAVGRVSPFVLLGHSKLFNALNACSLKPFLRHVCNCPLRSSFAALRDMSPTI